MGRWLPYVLLLGLVAATGWLQQQLATPEKIAAPGERHAADFFMQDFESITMNELGVPKRTLQAKHLAHYPDTDSNELEQPYIVLHHPEKPPWHVRSERGWVNSDSSVLLLLGTVKIWREESAEHHRIDIETSDLRVLPESDYGETDKAVIIRTPTTETRGIGMRAYMERGRVEILSKVHTRYEQ